MAHYVITGEIDPEVALRERPGDLVCASGVNIRDFVDMAGYEIY